MAQAGAVATMNKEVRKKNADESNHSRLMRQAQQEPKWFRDEGLTHNTHTAEITWCCCIGEREERPAAGYDAVAEWTAGVGGGKPERVGCIVECVRQKP